MKKISSVLILASSLFLSGCYSVFSGGTGGKIVDAESTSNPKSGIAFVDIYAYTDEDERNADFDSWQEGTTFSPSDTYYGHTTSDNDGSFVLSNIVWKETKPDFGRDADYTKIYLLYYHENYGLTKDQTLLISDSTSDTVYAELTAIRKTSVLNINLYDVTSSNQTANDVLVTITVPQATDTINAAAKVYKQSITGNGNVTISYPRWKTKEDKENQIEYYPEISISYFQNADEITWKACANADNDAKDYSFLEDNFSLKKTVRNTPYNISLYGKASRINFPAINGTYGDTSLEANDGKIIKMLAKDSAGAYTIDCGETTTYAQTVGTSSNQTHGNFSNLGNGYYWTDNTYTGKYSTIDVKLFAEGSQESDGSQSGITQTLRSDTASYNITIAQ